MRKTAFILVLKRIFLRKITIFKWQLNFLVVISVFIGIVFGSYVGISNILKVKAANDTHNTWTFNLANANQYTYNTNDLEVSDSGIYPKNRIVNGTFDTNLSSWSGQQTYTLDDEFTTALPTTLVSGVSTLTNGGVITPVLGTEMVSNGNFSNGVTGWTNAPSYLYDTFASQTGTLHLVTTGTTERIAYSSNMPVTTGVWYAASFTNTLNSGTAIPVQIKTSSTGTLREDFSSGIGTYRSLYTENAVVAADDTPAYAGDENFDNISLKPLTLSSLFSTVDSGNANTTVSANVTLTIGTEAGVVANLDSASNPQNFLIAYHDGINAHLDRCIGGVYTSLINTPTAYVIGAQIKIVKDARGFSLVYNGTQVGITQSLSNPEIINNTIDGLFSTYASNSFTSFSIMAPLNGTQAEPVGGARVISDATNKFNISSGILNISGGVNATNTPGIWYTAIPRVAGRILMFNATNISGSGTAYLGFAPVALGVTTDTITVSGGALYTNAVTISFVSAISLNVNYQYALILRSTGLYYFIRGGTQYPNWTLFFIDTRYSTTPVSPAFVNYNSIVNLDNIKIPVSTWLPTPVAYDTFTTNGATSTEAVGPDGQTTPQLSWTGGVKSGGTMAITPIEGNNLLTNGTFDADANWTKQGGAGWTIGSGVATHANGVAGIIYETGISSSIGKWYHGTFDITNAGGGLVSMSIGGNVYGGYKSTVGTFNIYARSLYASDQAGVYAQATGGNVSIDNVILKQQSLPSLFATVNAGTNNGIFDVTIPALTTGTQAGLVIGLDSASNPQNFIIAYLDGAGNAVVEQDIAGTYSTVISAKAAAWSASGVLRVIKDGTSVFLLYNNVNLASGPCSAAITGTLAGLFSTYSGNTFDNFTIFSRTGYTDAPFEDLTVTQDTGVKYSGAGSAKLVAGGTDGTFTQSVNAGDTSTYSFSAYAYKGSGQSVTNNDINIYYDTGIVTTTFTSVGNDWYRISANIVGTNAAKSFGFKVKAGKTIYIDNVSLVKTGNMQVYTTAAYSNSEVNTWDSLATSSTTPGTSAIKYQLCTDNGSTCESGNSWEYYNGSSWVPSTNITTDANTTDQLTQDAMQALSTTGKKLSVKAILQFTDLNTPTLSSITLGLTTDITPPDVNASDITMTRTTNGTSVDLNGWTKELAPKFEWTAGSDAANGSGLQGYCLYLGTNPSGDPTIDKGILGTSPIDATGKPCQFIVSASTPYIDFSDASLRGNPWLVSSTSPYYLNIKAIDNVNLVYTGDSAPFHFLFDNTPPTNVSYISCASGNFSNVIDMNFAWPTTGGSTSSDDISQVLGWQYQINGTDSSSWEGTSAENPNILGVGNYIPTSESEIHLDQTRDGNHINSGNNVIYFRTVSNSGQPSTDATVRTCNLSFGGQAPTFGGSDKVTITPSVSTDNSYSLSWPESTPAVDQSVTHYYYMINTTPPASLATLQSNVSTYFDNGTNLTVNANSLPNVNKGTNTVYVVAIDDSTTPNYSPSNYISGIFTLNSTDPDNVGDLVASDSSIKSKSQWNVTLTWTEPVYQGAGNLTYVVYRSDDNQTFTQVGTASGLSYVDNVPASQIYYYKVYTKDGANAKSSGTNSVSILPTGKWTQPPAMVTEPVVSNITTKKAVISWSTDRTSDSKISYGTVSQTYNVVEPSNPNQVTAHSIQLTGLNPDTIYYFKTKWTDEDGNTGISDEYSFKTQPAPVVKNVTVSNIGLSSALVTYTVVGASNVKIYYGTTVAFGGAIQVPTSTDESTYSTIIPNLTDGTKYYFKINSFDTESYEYDGTVLDFTTLPRPKITNVQIQEVVNTAQTTLQVTWQSNTNISSIVTYYPEGKPGSSRDVVSLQMINGAHKLQVTGLSPQTSYYIIVKGKDKIGNEADSDILKVTTATDTRPPVLTSLTVEGSVIPRAQGTAQQSYSQLVVSWDTDEPGTSQVEFGEGTGTTYQQRTSLDTNLTYNHIVVISGLTPSKVYHLHAISSDKAGNIGTSIDTVTITPKATDNALNLVISNLQDIFSFIK